MVEKVKLKKGYLSFHSNADFGAEVQMTYEGYGITVFIDMMLEEAMGVRKLLDLAIKKEAGRQLAQMKKPKPMVQKKTKR